MTMKKISIILFVLPSLLAYSQTWDGNYPDNVFKDTYRMPYENSYDRQDHEQQLYQKKGREIAQEAEDVRIILNGTRNIFGQTEHDFSVESQDESLADNSPGAPGEPVPINDDKIILIIAAIVIIIFQKRSNLQAF